MSLPYPIDPSLPSNPSPLFSDTTAVRGDQLRANNAEIWSNFSYIVSTILANAVVGNSSGNIPLSNGTLSVNLNAELFNGLTLADIKNLLSPELKKYKNILGKRKADSPNTKLDFSFDELWVQGVKLTSKSYTIDQTVSGALGVDTGSVAASTWYALYVLTNDTGSIDTMVMSVNFTAPQLPAGYTKYTLISKWYTAVTTKYFVDMVQENNIISYSSLSTMRTATTELNETFDASQWIPPLTYKAGVALSCSCTYNASITNATIYLYQYINNTYCLMEIVQSNSATTGNTARANISAVIGVSSRAIKFQTVVANSPSNISSSLGIQYFEIPL